MITTFASAFENNNIVLQKKAKQVLSNISSTRNKKNKFFFEKSLEIKKILLPLHPLLKTDTTLTTASKNKEFFQNLKAEKK